MTDRELAKALQRSGAVPAFLTSLGVFSFLLAQSFISRLIRTAQTLTYGGEFADETLESIWAAELALALGGPLFFAIGVFLCLWQLAPIAGGLRLAHVVTRAVLAATVGAACLWVFRFFAGFIHIATTPELRAHPETIGGAAFDALMDSLITLVGLLPLVVLGAVFLWGWLQRHPPKQVSKGTLDEV